MLPRFIHKTLGILFKGYNGGRESELSITGGNGSYFKMNIGRDIDKIIIHCSATTPTMDIGVDVVRDWHVKGNGWYDIGYHDLIRLNGKIEKGRPLERSGAHTKGYNKRSIGICMVGGVDENGKPKDTFTEKQWRSLCNYLRKMKDAFPNATIHGHNEFSSKACPSFNVQDELRAGRLKGV